MSAPQPHDSFCVQGVCNFMAQIARGLKNPKAKVPYSNKDKSLGDRSTYIGASSATGCLYKAYYDVRDGLKREHDAKQIFVFERGHQLEEMIRKGLNGLGYQEIHSVTKYKGLPKSHTHQEEVVGEGEFEFIKGHIDFVFINSRELVIKEMKSAATIPTEPYMSHRYQVLMQMWLLKTKYPDKAVRASVVYHNWDTGESEDYAIEMNETLLNIALNQALTLWNSFQNEEVPEATRQLYCSKCSCKDTCPKLCLGAVTDLPDDLTVLAQRLSDFKSAEKTMKRLKENFLAMLTSAGISKAKLGENILEVCNGQYGPYLKIT